MAKVTSIEAMLLKTQLRWAGHVSGMEGYHLPKFVLYGELSTGHHDKGAPWKRYKDTLKKFLVTCNINHHQWTTQPANRMNWRHSVYQATTSFKTTRRVNMEDKRRRRKNRDPSEIIEQIVTCSRCGKTRLSRIGFINLYQTRTSSFLYLSSQSRAMMMMIIRRTLYITTLYSMNCNMYTCYLFISVSW